MSVDPIAQTTRSPRQVTSATLRSALHSRRFRGPLLGPDDPGYEVARHVWNALIDRHPALIARCLDAADVAAAVRVASEHRPVVSIRGGGHQVAGSAVCDDGLVIDCSLMREIVVDPGARTVRVEAGATWGEVDRATQAHGLATPGGEVSETGVAGLTLGGGLGSLMRAHGLSCDNLVDVELVTADGVLRTASATQHEDLFWALRGGGRGIGVVTSFRFRLHPVGPEVAVAQTLYPYEHAASVARAWRDAAVAAATSVSPELVLWSLPPDPDVPPELHGAPVIIAAGLHAGAPSSGAAVLTPLRELGPVLADQSATLPYVDAQRALDASFPAGGRYYMTSHFLDGLPDEVLDLLLACDADRPTPESLIVIRTLGGAVAQVAADGTAFAHRRARFNVSVDACWRDPAMDARAIGWARATWDALAPFASGVYLNFAGLEDEAAEHVAAIAGSNADRLARVRASYDPGGVLAAAARRP